VKKIDTQGHPLVSPFELQALRRELLILKMIKHPNLIEYYGYMFEDPHYYIITELASCNLLQYLSSDISIPWEIKLHIIRGLCCAVQALHQLGIAHRDLKTENCLLVDYLLFFFSFVNYPNALSHLFVFQSISGSGSLPIVKLADFGISRVQDNGVTQAVGTFNYMAPECMNSVGGVRITPRTGLINTKDYLI
jgi:serine/threonine protein kinase